MDISELKNKVIRDACGIGPDYNNVFTFIDFGNVTKWFTKDRQDNENRPLSDEQFIQIDLEKLKEFLHSFSIDVRFYYGHNSHKAGSMAFLYKTKHIFSDKRVSTKPIQWVRHHITDEEAITTDSAILSDDDGKYIMIPKCNFDVEISVDAVKMLNEYDTFCLLSGDADFTYLNTYLRAKKKKKIILLKNGNITRQLRASADLVISASDIKRYITRIESKNLAQGQVSADNEPGYPGQVTSL